MSGSIFICLFFTGVKNAIFYTRVFVILGQSAISGCKCMNVA